MITYEKPSGIHGVMASFENADMLVAAADKARGPLFGEQGPTLAAVA